MADIDVPQPVKAARPKVSGPTTQRKNPTDFTGVVTERQNAENEAARRAAASEGLAMANPPAPAAPQTISPDQYEDDYRGSDTPMPVVEVQAVETAERMVPIEVHTRVEDMVFGRTVIDPGDPEEGRPAVMGGLRMWNFFPGQRYTVSRDMADHLEDKGYISYRGY